MTTAIELHGFCDERFLPLRDAFAANFADGLEPHPVGVRQHLLAHALGGILPTL